MPWAGICTGFPQLRVRTQQPHVVKFKFLLWESWMGGDICAERITRWWGEDPHSPGYMGGWLLDVPSPPRLADTVRSLGTLDCQGCHYTCNACPTCHLGTVGEQWHHAGRGTNISVLMVLQCP